MGRAGLKEARLSRKGPEKPAKPASTADQRKQRLAEALRANLKRRKAGNKLTKLTSPSGKPEATGE
jgi:hypothetical protein